MRGRDAIARIEIARSGGPAIRGTGALVGDRLLLTALHVVADRQASPPAFFPGPIQLEFPGGRTTATVRADLWDPQLDFVLLECATVPGGVHPLPLGEVGASDTDGEWETFGFPDVNPAGMRMAGKLRDPSGSYQGVSALQLFCDEAASGDGAPVAGLSGAPCIVGGAVVGVIRSSLMQRGLNAAGTLYACPIGPLLDKAGTLLPLPDPCRGLPGLPRRDLPSAPFRDLAWYTAADAELLFGRDEDIRDLYQRIVAPDGEPIILFTGQSGVGKSSLMDAGVGPRLAFDHAVRYARRDAARGLRACLEAVLDGDWRAAEEREGRPIVVILDQVEEAYTRRRGDPEAEVGELLELLVAIFGDPARRPRGRLVLSLRSEWSSKFRKRIENRGLPLGEHHLERLTRRGIIDVVHGIERTTRLVRKYNVTVEEGLGELIADDLFDDDDSAIAPTLQILMTRLWSDARKIAPASPRLTSERYRALKRDGLHLRAFLDRQIAELPAAVQPHVASGLVDDILASHTRQTNGILTANNLSAKEIKERYAQIAPAELFAIVREAQHKYLLTSPAGDGGDAEVDDGDDANKGDGAPTRLAHDTLAPLVMDRLLRSITPGARARRLLDLRAPEWAHPESATTLDPRDLKIVEAGEKGTRARSDLERLLIAASRTANQRRWIPVGAAAVAMIGLIAITGVVWKRGSSARTQSEAAERKAQRDSARLAFDKLRTERNPSAVLERMAQVLQLAPDDDPAMPFYVARTLRAFDEGPVASVPLGPGYLSASFSEDGRRVTLIQAKGAYTWSIDASDLRAGLRVTPLDGAATIDADPRRRGPRAARLRDGAPQVVDLVERDGGKVLTPPSGIRAPAPVLSAWPSPSGDRVVLLSDRGGRQSLGWYQTRDGKRLAECAVDSSLFAKDVTPGAVLDVAESGRVLLGRYGDLMQRDLYQADPECHVARVPAECEVSEWTGGRFRAGTDEVLCGNYYWFGLHSVSSPIAGDRRAVRQLLTDPIGAWNAADGSRRMVIDKAGWLRLWLLTDGAPDTVIPPAAPGDLITNAAFDAKGTRLALVRRDASVELWSLGPPLRQIWSGMPGLPLRAEQLVISESDDRVLAVTEHRLELFDATGRRESQAWPMGTDLTAAFDGPAIAVFAIAPGGGCRIDRWTPGKPRQEGVVHLKNERPSFAIARFARDPRWVILQYTTGVSLIDAHSGDLHTGLSALRDGDPALAVTVIRDAVRVAVEPIDPGGLRAVATLDTAPGVLIQTIGSQGSIGPDVAGVERWTQPVAYFESDYRVAAFSAAGPWLVGRELMRQGGLPPSFDALRIDSLGTGSTLATLVRPGRFLASRFSSDGVTLTTVSSDGAIRRELVRHPYARRPAWITGLYPFATGQQRRDGGAFEPALGMAQGPARAAFLKQLEEAARAGDRGAAFAIHAIDRK